MPRGRVALWSAGALLAIALFSLSDTSSWGYRVPARFVIELSQNIFFACSLGIVLLWVWKLRNDPEDRFAARFVSVLGVYFSLFVLIYGARQLVPHASSLGNLYPMLGAWLPLGWLRPRVPPIATTRDQRSLHREVCFCSLEILGTFSIPRSPSGGRQRTSCAQ